jgi:hypothetical protein
MRCYDEPSANHVPPAAAEDDQGTLKAWGQRPPAKQPAAEAQTPPSVPAASPASAPAVAMAPPVDVTESTVLGPPLYAALTAQPPAAVPIPLAAGPPEAVCRRVRLSDEAAQLLVGRQTLLTYLFRLMKWQLYRDAAGVLAHALPQRSGIWWAWECARLVAPPLSSAGVVAALEATQAWLAELSEERRRACGKAAAEVGPGTPAGSAALAVFWTADTPITARRPSTFGLEHFPAQAVASAVILAALEGDPAGAAQRYVRFLGEGIALATGLRAAP